MKNILLSILGRRELKNQVGDRVFFAGEATARLI
jgi:hypothetical protein